MKILEKLSGKKRNHKKGSHCRVLKRYIYITIGIVLFLLFISYKYDPLVPGIERKGILQSVFGIETRYGSYPKFVIQLDDGKIVNVNASRMGAFKKNRNVIVQEMKSKIFHKVVYCFIRYDE